MTGEVAISDFFAGRENRQAELAEQIFQRMRAPGNENVPAERTSFSWLARDAAIAGPLGLFAGVLFFVVFSGMGQKRPAVVPARAASPEEKPAIVVVEPTIDNLSVSDTEHAPRLAAVPEDSAQRAISQAVAARGGNAWKNYRRLLAGGWRLVEQQKYGQAAVRFGRAIRLRPQDAEGYYGLALSLFEQGNEPEALSVIERITGRKGGKADLWLLLGTVYQFIGDEVAARDAYRKYVTSSPRGRYAGDVKALLSRPQLPRLNLNWETAAE